jgi:site-specific DNA recombinase
VSTSEQAENGTSIENQLENLRGYCKAQSWAITQEYVDAGFTGKNSDRPALQQLLRDAKSGLFAKVVVYKLDRFSRNLRLMLELEEKLKSHDVALLSLKESIDTSIAIGRTVFQVLGLVGEWEREAIIERTKSGRIQRYKQGCWAGGKPAYGYRYNRDTKKLVVDEKEARVVHRIYTEYKNGKSLCGVTHLLNGEKIPTQYSSYWKASVIRNILVNPAYKGKLVVNRHTHICNIDKVDMTKAIVIDVPPIVDEPLWDAVQKRLDTNKAVKPVKSNQLLQGLITCGECGLSYHPDKAGGVQYYMCRGKLAVAHVDGSPRCTAPNWNKAKLEQQVWQRIEDILNDPNKLQPMLEETIANLREKDAELRARIMPIDERLAQILDQKARLAESWVKMSLTKDKQGELQRNLDQEETRLKGMRGAIDPAQIEDMEKTAGMLRFWQGQLSSMAWNTENEDGTMVKTMNKPHERVLSVVGLEDLELTSLLGFPATRREILDRLQVHLYVFKDRVEIKSVFEIAPVGNHLCTSMRRLR